MMGSECRYCQQMSSPTWTAVDAHAIIRRELACPSGSEGTDGPRSTTQLIPAHTRQTTAWGRHGGEEVHREGRKGPRVTSRAKSLPGSRVQALQDLRALVPHLTHHEPPKNVSAQGAPARSPAQSTDTTGANRSQHVPTRQPAAAAAGKQEGRTRASRE